MVYPLLELLKKEQKFEWNETHQEAFEQPEKLFDKNVALKFPNLSKPYILITYASYYAVAGMLSQRNDNDEEKIITFTSRVLKNSEINYFTT